MGIGPCILTKVICAFFMGDARWVIGWAMVGRAEFAHLGNRESLGFLWWSYGEASGIKRSQPW